MQAFHVHKPHHHGDDDDLSRADSLSAYNGIFLGPSLVGCIQEERVFRAS